MPDAPATLTLHLSADPYQGPPIADVAVDGIALESVAVLAVHGKATHPMVIRTTYGPHAVAVTFANDAWGGTADTDRNLFVDGMDLDGVPLPGTAGALYSNGTLTFALDLKPTRAGLLARHADALADAGALAALLAVTDA